ASPHPLDPSAAPARRSPEVRTGNGTPARVETVANRRDADMDLGLHEHTALITGADSGIGLACAQTLLAEGASVVIADQYPDQLAATAAQLDHPRLHHFPVDVTSNESIEELTGYISTLDTPYADILINAAGIHGPDSAFHEIDDDGWRETFEVNLFGSVRMTRAVLPWMRERGWGRV